MPVPMALVSVMPQPVFGSAFPNARPMLRTWDGARGAPPPPTVTNELRSR